MTDSENILRWLVLDARALINGHNGILDLVRQEPICINNKLLRDVHSGFRVFLMRITNTGPQSAVSSLQNQAGNRDSIGPVGAVTKKMMINWLSRASVILLLVVNFWLIARFTGFSVSAPFELLFG